MRKELISIQNKVIVGWLKTKTVERHHLDPQTVCSSLSKCLMLTLSTKLDCPEAKWCLEALVWESWT